jgi:NitT/TauT family transport system permease protein
VTALLSRPGVAPVVGLLAGFGLWELAGRAGVSSALPPFSDVIAAIRDEWTSAALWSATSTTLAAIAIGLPIAIGLGVVVGVLMGMFRVVGWLLSPYVTIFLSVPLTALVPVLLLVFGLNRSAVVAAIFVYTFFVVALNTQAGVENVDRDLLDMGRSFGASRVLVARRIVLPSAEGITLAGVRIATGRAFKGAIVTEQVIGLLGLGGRVQRLGGAFAVERLYAVVLTIGMMGLASMELVRLAERSSRRPSASWTEGI